MFACLAALFGAAVAVGELVARYRDEPRRAVRTGPALFYLALNIAASTGAFALARAFEWKFGAAGASSSLSVQVTQALVAGFGAMALFRTSLFIVRVGGQDVGMGPAGFLQATLGAADRGVDRRRASDRAKRVPTIMQDVSFAKAHQALPAYCLALMQNLSSEEQAQLGRQIQAIRDATMEDFAKVLTLGLTLMNVVGEDVLAGAVSSLGDQIKS